MPVDPVVNLVEVWLMRVVGAAVGTAVGAGGEGVGSGPGGLYIPRGVGVGYVVVWPVVEAK